MGKCCFLPLHSPETFEEARRGETKYNSTMCATTEIESENEGEEWETREQEKRKRQ